MSVQTFIEQIAPIIQNESISRGYKICSTVIAQAIIESRYGESKLASYGNYFGLKCGKYWQGPSVNMKTNEEYKVGQVTQISDNFRCYLNTDGTPSMLLGVIGYYDFINTKRYANLKTANSHVEYANYLKSDGYATSSTYVQTLVKTVEKYNLTRYDSRINIQAQYTIGVTYTLLANMYIRNKVAGDKVEFINITTNAQANAYTDDDGYAILKKGSKVTCKSITEINGAVWMRIPSGWCCARKEDKIYIA